MKIWTEAPVDVGLRELVPVFHRWIQRGAVEGPLVDVADYTHVAGGPGVLLAAFDANYSVDISDGTLCFVWSRKRPSGLSLQDTLIQGANRVVALCTELEAEFHGRLRFLGGAVGVFSNDRLLAPNTDLTEQEWRPALQGLAGALWGGCDLDLERGLAGSRERFGVVLRSRCDATLRDLHANLKDVDSARTGGDEV